MRIVFLITQESIRYWGRRLFRVSDAFYATVSLMAVAVAPVLPRQRDLAFCHSAGRPAFISSLCGRDGR
jgi:peptidoglycan/LPS O-acetylase OafA/YrhL